MDTNVYQTPQANLVIDQEKDDHMFYVVSPKKFWVLFMATLGLYAIYWFYKNWSQYKKATGDNSWPVARAIFNIFFTHALFRKINNKLIEKNIESDWKHVALATLYVVIVVLDRVLDRLAGKSISEAVSVMFSLISIPVTGWILYQAQLKINLVCESLNGEDNSNFSAANIIWILLGALFWLVFLAGLAIILNPELVLPPVE